MYWSFPSRVILRLMVIQCTYFPKCTVTELKNFRYFPTVLCHRLWTYEQIYHHHMVSGRQLINAVTMTFLLLKWSIGIIFQSSKKMCLTLTFTTSHQIGVGWYFCPCRDTGDTGGGRGHSQLCWSDINNCVMLRLMLDLSQTTASISRRNPLYNTK